MKSFLGIIISGHESDLEQLLRYIEKRRGVKVVYVKKAGMGEFLLIVKTKRVENDGQKPH